jgi:sortase A
MPGQGGTVSLFGHRVTPVKGRTHGPFRYINLLKRGDRIIIRMPYGRFVYRVTGHRIVHARQWGLFRARRGHERLTIAACSDKDGKPGWATHRYVVIAREERS